MRSKGELRVARHASWRLAMRGELAPYQRLAVVRLRARLAAVRPGAVRLDADSIDALAHALRTCPTWAHTGMPPAASRVLARLPHASRWPGPDRGVRRAVRDRFARWDLDHDRGFYLPMPDRATFEACLADTGVRGTLHGPLAAHRLGRLFDHVSDVSFGALDTPVINIGFRASDHAEALRTLRLAATITRIGAHGGADTAFSDAAMHCTRLPDLHRPPHRVLLLWRAGQTHSPTTTIHLPVH